MSGPFTVTLPLPPPDNALSRTGGLIRHPTAKYKAWLDVSEDILQEALNGRPTDAERWWIVKLAYYMPSRGDMPNREKAVLDLLAGSILNKANGRVEKSGCGLFDDDKRVRRVVKEWVEIGTPVADARVYVCAMIADAGPVQYVKPKRPRTATAAP